MKNSKRRFFGAIFGLWIGLLASFQSSKANAFLSSLISPEKLFEMFLSAAGGIMMRFFGYRFSSNWDNAWKKYNENRFEQQEKLDTSIINTQTKINQSIIDALQMTNEHELSLDTHVGTNACVNTSYLIASNSIDTTKNAYITNSNVLLQKLLYKSSSSRSINPDNINQIKNSAKNKINDKNEIETLELYKIATEESIENYGVALEESLLLYSDLLSHLSLSQDVDKTASDVVILSKYQSIELIHHCIGRLISYRLSSINVNELNLSNFSNEIKSTLSSKVSELDLIRLECLEMISSPEYLSEINDSPSMAFTLGQISLLKSINSKVQKSINEIDELIILVRSLRAIKA